jgi:hypothetical protein
MYTIFNNPSVVNNGCSTNAAMRFDTQILPKSMQNSRIFLREFTSWYKDQRLALHQPNIKPL